MKKPKIAVAQKPTPKAKAEQPVVSVDAVTKPKKMTTSQKAPKKEKAVSPKVVAQVAEAATPGGIWPNWVENLLIAIGVKKKQANPSDR